VILRGAMSGLSAKKRFEQVRKAVARLHSVQIMIQNDCDEWRPPSVFSKNAKPDPTANAAIRNVDELGPKLAGLRAEEAELIDMIGEALVIIQAVRDGFGEQYGDLLEWRYIDCLSWGDIRFEYDVTRTTGQRKLDIAFDWIDSIGITRILAGYLEI